MSTIFLERAYIPDGSAVWARLELPGGWSCYTLEPPWEGNERYISCIPEGRYTMRMRESGVVRDTTGGEYTEGWEITAVDDRSFIMIHPGNYARHTEGCIMPGAGFSWNGGEGPMVTHSQRTFDQLMSRLADQDEWRIDIRARTVGYP